jgi:hypothetical protein
MKIRRWRLAGELQRELNRHQTQERLRSLAQPSSDLSRNAMMSVLRDRAFRKPEKQAKGFKGCDLKIER